MKSRRSQMAIAIATWLRSGMAHTVAIRDRGFTEAFSILRKNIHIGHVADRAVIVDDNPLVITALSGGTHGAVFYGLGKRELRRLWGGRRGALLQLSIHTLMKKWSV